MTVCQYQYTDSLIVTVGAEKSTPKITVGGGAYVVADQEKREDDKSKTLVYDINDFSDEQLLAEFEDVKATLSESEFSGIENRIYQKLHKRLKEEASTVPVSDTLVAAAVKPSGIRFKKKKILSAALLAAAFVGMLGVTAVGEKNYFFRGRETSKGITYNNDKNAKYDGDLKEAYQQIEDELKIDALRLGYTPQGMKFVDLEVAENKAILIFSYKDLAIRFIQEEWGYETSIGTASDREKIGEDIYNPWLDKTILLEEEAVDGEYTGYGISINKENAHYRIIGQLPKEEMIKIAENLNF